MSRWSVLVHTRTTGYRHASIPAAVRALAGLGERHGFAVEATEDPAVFRPGLLARHRAVVFLSTSGTVLDDAGRAALRGYVERGGGWMGVHSAAGTEPGWAFYGELVGTRFAGHPEIQTADADVVDRDHPATAHLGDRWTLTDEWYNFISPPPGSVRVLLAADELRYRGGTMGGDHPLAWCRPVGAGRSFYTAFGHADAAYADPAFLAHLLGGLRYAADVS